RRPANRLRKLPVRLRRRDKRASPDYTSSKGSRGGPEYFDGGTLVSIVRVGLSEKKGFSDGYDAIFGAKTGGATKKKPAGKKKAATAAPKKKKTTKKK